MKKYFLPIFLLIFAIGAILSGIGFQNGLLTNTSNDLADESQAYTIGTNNLDKSTVSLQTDNQENNTQKIIIAERYTWSIIKTCLSNKQRESVSEVVSETGYSRTQMEYSAESDGNVLMYTPPDFDPIAETKNDDFQCPLVQDIVTVMVTPTPQSTAQVGDNGQGGAGGGGDGIGTDNRGFATLAGFALSFAMFAIVVVFVLYILYREYYNTDDTASRT